MTEIMNHPWMTKGFGGAPDNFLPQRQPLQLPLDRTVIRKMDGFDFGSANAIEDQLVKIAESDDYQRAIKNMEKRINTTAPDADRKRGVFDFYKRRNSLSRDMLNTSSEAVPLGADPINAYSPLISIYYLAKEKIDREAREANPGALSIPKSPGEKPLQLPDLPAPQAAYTNSATYEMAGERPTGGRARPRARTHGEDEEADTSKEAKSSPTPQVVVPQDQPSRRESTAVGLFRRLSTRRNKDSDREKGGAPPALAVSAAPDAAGIPKKSFSIRRREQSAARLSPSMAGEDQQPQMLSPSPPGDSVAKRFGLGRSTSVNSGDYRQRLARRGVSEGSSMRPPPKTPPTERRPSTDHDAKIGGDATSDIDTPRTAPPASRTRSLGHARRESIQKRRAERMQMRTSNVPEETDAEIAEQEEDDFDAGTVSGTEGGSPSGMKPVFLKGLFSVSTTSSKPFRDIERDIIRVLKELNVQYSSNGKGGFKCRHAPSIDLNTPAEEPIVKKPSGSLSHRRKISFGGFMSGDRDRDDVRQQKMPQTPDSTRSGSRRGPDQPSENSDDTDDDGSEGNNGGSRRQHSTTAMPSTAGETTTHVTSDMGNNMTLRFEIFVVKVPLIGLHGIQFKKVDGGTWQYKNMAQKILNELRL